MFAEAKTGSPLLDMAIAVLIAGPSIVPLTFTVTVQVAPGARVPPRTAFTLLFSVRNMPAHVLIKPSGVANDKPAGKISTTLTASGTVGFGFVSVRVTVVVPFKPTVAVPKAFVSITSKGAFT